MRMEQVVKHRKPPDSVIVVDDAANDEKRIHKLHMDDLEARRTAPGWSRFDVDVSKEDNRRSNFTSDAVKAAAAATATTATSVTEKEDNLHDHTSIEPPRPTVNGTSSIAVGGDTAQHGQQNDGNELKRPHTSPIPFESASMRIIPGIVIDKPLPAFPSASSESGSSRSASPPGVETVNASANDIPLPAETSHAPRIKFRRIKSFGDLLSSSSPASAQQVERRASYVDLRQIDPQQVETEDHDHITQGRPEASTSHRTKRTFSSPKHPLLSVPTSPHASSSNSKLVKKRSSSLGLGRRPSSTSTITIRPMDIDDIEGDQGKSATARNVSSATAPASTKSHDVLTDFERKRKPSMLSGLFSGFWRSKKKDATVSSDSPSSAATEASADIDEAKLGSQAEIPENTTSLQNGGRSSDASSAESTAASVITNHEGAPPPPDAPVTQHSNELAQTLQPAPAQHPRRYSMLHALFRPLSPHPAASSRESLLNPSPSSSDASLAHLPIPPSLPQQPIDIPNTSLPQLPSIDHDLADLTFGSLFEIGGRSRSRASTKSSTHSFFSSSLRNTSPKRTPPASPRISQTRSRSNSHLQQSTTAADVGQVDLARVPTIKARDRPSLPPTLDTSTVSEHASDRPVSPVIASIISSERRHKTRLFRSNSASSVTTSGYVEERPESPHAINPSARPAYGRSRSSSTVSARTANRLLHPVVEGSVTPSHNVFSPTITVTVPPPSSSSYFEKLPLQSYSSQAESPIEMESNLPGRTSRSSSVATSTGSPAFLPEGMLWNPELGEKPEPNLVDAMSDFVLTPPVTPGLRFSADTQRSGRSSFSAGSSMPSVSPTTSIANGPAARASTIIQKTLRRRANTMGSLLSSSVPASGAGDLDKMPDLLQGGSKSGHSSSSSRLSALFPVSPSILSSSPRDDSENAWLAHREASSLSGVFSPPLSQSLGRARPVRRKFSASLLASPQFGPVDSDSGASSPRMSTVSLTPSAAASATKELSSLRETVSDLPEGSSPSRSRSASQPLSGHTFVHPNPMPDETPLEYVARVKAEAPARDLAVYLAKNADSFHAAALRLYLEEYDFVNDPIDIALRKLLLGMHLPRETQQIDRVMEAFAERYNACNPALFSSPDQPYILAFSIIMLHTDAFNKSNKNKMTRADYVKNTKVDGIPEVLLEYIYDNTTSTPFIYAEDLDVSGGAPNLGLASSMHSTSSSKDKQRVDVYKLMALDQLSKLRIDMSLIVPTKNPFSYTGTVAFFDCTALHNAFVFAHTMNIPDQKRRPANHPSGSHEEVEPVEQLRIARVGSLERKDDLAHGGKKSSSRKWKTWSVILTDSHLLLFRDIAVAHELQQAILRQSALLELPQNVSQSAHLSEIPDFRADEIISLNDTIALYDFTYARYSQVFRLIQPNGRQILLKASDDADLNLWMSTINYASTFSTAGIRILRHNEFDGQHDFGGDLLELPHASLQQWSQGPKMSTATTISAKSDSSTATIDGTQDREAATVDDLRSDREDQPLTPEDLFFSRTVHSNVAPVDDRAEHSWNTSRANLVRAKVLDLEADIRQEQATLAADLRLVRNIAILTPLTSVSRHRVAQAAQPVARRIRQVRQTIAKLICYRECLCRDLLATQRETLRDRYHRPSQIDLKSRGGQHAPFERTKTDFAAEARPRSAVVLSANHSNTMISKSASQDELSGLTSPTPFFSRSLTSEPRVGKENRVYYVTDDHRSTNPVIDNGQSRASSSLPGSPAPSISSSRAGMSPALSSGVFETVAEGVEP